MNPTPPPTPQSLRDAAANALKAPGRKRIAARAKLDEIETELKPLVIAAVENEVPYRAISIMTGLSQTTIRAWSKHLADGTGAA